MCIEKISIFYKSVMNFQSNLRTCMGFNEAWNKTENVYKNWRIFSAMFRKGHKRI